MVTPTLRSVIFADGQFVGADEQRGFAQFTAKLKAIVEVGIMAKTQAWDQVEALAQTFAQRPSNVTPRSVEDPISTRFRQLAAMRLAQMRKYKGEAAADQLAQIYSSLPTLWK